MRYVLITIVLWMLTFARPTAGAESPAWSGVDETVVERFATEAGRPPRDPYINTDRGDLLLFMFLVAGAGGGFLAGYAFRSLFPPQRDCRDTHAPLL